MMGANIARRYAKALIEIGTDSGSLDALVREITAIAEAIDASPELRSVIENPQVSRATRKLVMLEIAQRFGSGAMARNTISLLTDNGRLRFLPAIAQVLRAEADARIGVIRAQITSATPLSDAYAQRLGQALEAKYNKKVILQRDVDPSLISGVVTRVGDTIIDGSLRARLQGLRANLREAG